MDSRKEEDWENEPWAGLRVVIPVVIYLDEGLRLLEDRDVEALDLLATRHG